MSTRSTSVRQGGSPSDSSRCGARSTSASSGSGPRTTKVIYGSVSVRGSKSKGCREIIVFVIFSERKGKQQARMAKRLCFSRSENEKLPAMSMIGGEGARGGDISHGSRGRASNRTEADENLALIRRQTYGVRVGASFRRRSFPGAIAGARRKRIRALPLPVRDGCRTESVRRVPHEHHQHRDHLGEVHDDAHPVQRIEAFLRCGIAGLSRVAIAVDDRKRRGEVPADAIIVPPPSESPKPAFGVPVKRPPGHPQCGARPPSSLPPGQLRPKSSGRHDPQMSDAPDFEERLVPRDEDRGAPRESGGNDWLIVRVR